MRIEPPPRENLPGVAIAIVAGLHKAVLMATASNDDYQHLTYARQLLGGDLPLRDFWDISTTLQEVLSAFSQVLFGHRLLAEALIVGLATAAAVFVAFRLIRTLTGSALIAVVCASLFVVAIPRTYSYPKWLVYSTAASLWWSYVWWPSTRKAVIAGVSVAVAFYWRHDHGVLVAIGVALGMVAAHGWTRDAARRTMVAGAVALLAVLPYLLFAAAVLGPISFVQTSVATFTDEQGRARADLRWPLRSGADFIGIKPQEWYAPEIIIRWKADLPPEARSAALDKYGLTPTADEGTNLQRVRLSERSLGLLRALVDDPQIEDTSRMERGSASFTRGQWPLLNRALFNVPVLRTKLLPGIDGSFEAGMAAAMMAHAIPLVALLLLVPAFRRPLPPAVTPRPLLLFMAFTAILNVGLLREPYNQRVADVLVLPVVLLAVLLTVLLHSSLPARVRWPARIAAVAVLVLTIKSLAVAGEFGTRVRWLTGEGQMARAREKWSQIAARLESSPPSRLEDGQTELATARLAEYVRRCVAPRDRILVLWYAPEIYYEADRLMAGRHLYFFPTFAGIEAEQRRELEKVTRFKPPIILSDDASSSGARKAFPSLVRYIDGNYVTGAEFGGDGNRYNILIRRDSPPRTVDKTTGWPCYGDSSG
jgi:hypothetical protein